MGGALDKRSFAAEGPTQIVGERLSKGWGQQVLIENQPSGGTNTPPSCRAPSPHD
jgi:hypothetical protein